jgi:hypothetical protein
MYPFQFTKGIVSDVRVFFSDEDYRVILGLLHELSWREPGLSRTLAIIGLEETFSFFDFYFPITPDNAGQFIRTLVFMLSKRHVMLQGTGFNASARIKRPFGCISTREVIALSNLCSEYCMTDLGILLLSSDRSLALLPSKGLKAGETFYYPQHSWSERDRSCVLYTNGAGVVTRSVAKIQYLINTGVTVIAATGK